MSLSTIYDPCPATFDQINRAHAIMEIQRITSNVTEETFKAGQYNGTVGVAILLRDRLIEVFKHFPLEIAVKVDVVDLKRLLIKVDAGKTGKVTLKVKRTAGGIWSRNFD